MPNLKQREAREGPEIQDPKPGNQDIDIDDAQIEPPRDDAFKGERPPPEKTRT